MVAEDHRVLIQALETRAYKALRVVRYGQTCYLLITLTDSERVFVDRFGKHVAYRHAWQVRDWLQDRFGILQTEVPFMM